MLRLLTFGGLSLETGDGARRVLEGQRKSLALLALLGSAGDRGLSRDRLLLLLWPESTQARARGALKQMIHGLRRELDVDRLTVGVNELRLDPDVISTDAAEFEAALARDDLDRAIALYRGAFLDGVHLRDAPEFERWVDEERARFQRQAARALETLAEHAAARGDHPAAVEHWRRLAALDPFSTHTALGLMNALATAGDRGAALRHFGVYERLMQEELDASADPAVLALATDLRIAGGDRADPQPQFGSARAPSVPAATPEPPGNEDAPPLPRPAPPGPPAAPRRALVYGIGAGVLAFAGLLVFAAPWRAASDEGLPSAAGAAADVPVDRAPAIAVLPFLDHSPRQDAEYFSDGVAEELIDALGRVDGLHVVARTSSFAFKGEKAEIAEIGRRLKASHVVEGSVRTSGDQLRITARLISAADGYHLWSETYERRLQDVFIVQAEISRAIVAALKIELAAGAEARLVRRATANLNAYNLYLRGRYHYPSREPDALQRALVFYEQAVDADPDFAPAHAGIAESLSMLTAHGFVRAPEAIPRARAAALRALELDAELSEAHAALGLIRTWHDWNWSGADASFERAIALSPANASARHWHSVHLASTGRTDESIAENERAVELDPVSVLLRTNLGIKRYLARDYQRALTDFHAALDLDPGHSPAWVWVGVTNAQLGRHGTAVAAADSGMVRGPFWPLLAAWRAFTYARAGRAGEARHQLESLTDQANAIPVAPSVIARAYAALGETDSAFAWLHKAYEEHDGWLSFLQVDPAFDPLRSDSRYVELLGRLGFEEGKPDP